MDTPGHPAQSPWALLRDIIGATVCHWGARLLSAEAKALLVRQLRAR